MHLARAHAAKTGGVGGFSRLIFLKKLAFDRHAVDQAADSAPQSRIVVEDERSSGRSSVESTLTSVDLPEPF